MDFASYEERVLRTAAPGSPDRLLAITALGLVGEAGEVAELVKKDLGHGRRMSREELVKELGDVLWYLTRMALLVGSSLEEVATKNANKLATRYPEGFSHEASRARVDTREAEAPPREAVAPAEDPISSPTKGVKEL